MGKLYLFTGAPQKHTDTQSVGEYVFNVFFDLKVRAFNVLSTKIPKSPQQKFSPQSFKMSSRLRFGFTLNYLSFVELLSVFIAMINQLFMALNTSL